MSILIDSFCESALDSVTVDNLTATLTAIGASAPKRIILQIQNLQNPAMQKRGGLGFGAFSLVYSGDSRPEFANVNLFNQQAQTSPLSIRESLGREGEFDIVFEGKIVGRMKPLPVPDWFHKNLRSGVPASAVLQQHGPRNLVAIWGKNRCHLFDQNSACTFCMFDGGDANIERNIDDLIEAFSLAAQNKRGYNLTLTTALLADEDLKNLVTDINRLKDSMGSSALALEIAPLAISNLDQFYNDLRLAGLDTVMIPMDLFTDESRDLYIPGKSQLVRDYYWENIKSALKFFGVGNVTSNLIVGIEPLAKTKEAIRMMLEAGVIPEPIPIRWDNSKLKTGRPLILTRPGDLVDVRNYIKSILPTIEIMKTRSQIKAGCAACGGCGGINLNQLGK